MGVDFGTSHTVAVIAQPGGRTEALLFDSSPLLASGVFADSGRLLVGRDAERAGRMSPAHYEPNPKRRIDDGALLLGGSEVPVTDAIGAVFARVLADARRALGESPAEVVLTHPAGWGPNRQSLLTAAADTAGLGKVRLIAEPVAAAAYFTTVLGHQVHAGHAVVVYDFGAGTFDISVVRRQPDGGWEVAAAAGLDDVGGVDLDAAIVDWLRRNANDAETWNRLTSPSSTTEFRARRQLWDDARAVKEQLTRASSAGLPIPLVDHDTHITREEFEEIARPYLDRTVALTTATLFTSGVTSDRLAGVFLVGGSSRIPQISTLLQRALGVAPVVIEQPELVVAYGSLQELVAPPTTLAASPSASTHPVDADGQSANAGTANAVAAPTGAGSSTASTVAIAPRPVEPVEASRSVQTAATKAHRVGAPSRNLSVASSAKPAGAAGSPPAETGPGSLPTAPSGRGVSVPPSVHGATPRWTAVTAWLMLALAVLTCIWELAPPEYNLLDASEGLAVVAAVFVVAIRVVRGGGRSFALPALVAPLVVETFWAILPSGDGRDFVRTLLSVIGLAFSLFLLVNDLRQRVEPPRIAPIIFGGLTFVALVVVIFRFPANAPANREAFDACMYGSFACIVSQMAWERDDSKRRLVGVALSVSGVVSCGLIIGQLIQSDWYGPMTVYRLALIVCTALVVAGALVGSFALGGGPRTPNSTAAGQID
ncbi:Hsp70 family protein [Dactylosporangium sp. NPDC049140]|uniref:Hsp70 family protein n=1 Tax=Dactylosporangium sp. NPDC049140 TaxID=3155647 RepID=UPI0033CFECAC